VAATIQLEVVTPAGRVFSEPVREVVVPTTGGELGIFPNHTPLTTIAQLGVVNIRRRPEDNDFDHIVVTSGLIEIQPDRVRILVDDAAHVDTIDELYEREQLDAAKERLQIAQEDREIATAEAAIARAAVWLDAAKLRK